MKYLTHVLTVLLCSMVAIALPIRSYAFDQQQKTPAVGIMSNPGNASQDVQNAPFEYRYNYLAGGVYNGWHTWNPNGSYAGMFIEDSINNGITPFLTFYNILQSNQSSGESADVLNNLQNANIMNEYFNNVIIFLEQAALFPNHDVYLHIEPDMWGFAHSSISTHDARDIPVAVTSSGNAEVAGFSNNLSGMAQAIISLRDSYASNVQLGYHVSIWGTGTDIVLQDPSLSEVTTLAQQASVFYQSLQADFDFIAGEFRDRDAGFYEEIYGIPNALFTPEDFDRHQNFFDVIHQQTSKPLVLWQIPFGDSTRSNSWGDYQDNIYETLFENNAYEAELYRSAGVEAFLFGGGADGVSGPNQLFYNTIQGYYDSTDPVDEEYPEGTLFRFWQRGSGSYFYTSSIIERDNLITSSNANWRYEGASFRGVLQTESNAIPVYRLWQPESNAHIFTISGNERQTLLDSANTNGLTWLDEGIAFYAYQEATADATPVYRFFSNQSGKHIFTSSEVEKENIEQNLSSEWIPEGLPFYALPLSQ